jgi:hypothetical protein
MTQWAIGELGKSVSLLCIVQFPRSAPQCIHQRTIYNAVSANVDSRFFQSRKSPHAFGFDEKPELAVK